MNEQSDLAVPNDVLKLFFAMLWTLGALQAIHWSPAPLSPLRPEALPAVLDLRTQEGRQKADQALEGVATLAKLALEKIARGESQPGSWLM